MPWMNVPADFSGWTPTLAHMALLLVAGSQLMSLFAYMFLILIFASAAFASMPQMNTIFSDPTIMSLNLLALAVFVLGMHIISLYAAYVAIRAVDEADYDRAYNAVSVVMLGELFLLPYFFRTLLGVGNRYLGLFFGAGVPLSLIAVTHYLRHMSRRNVA
jgi:uncharacterized membrane protein